MTSLMLIFLGVALVVIGRFNYCHIRRAAQKLLKQFDETQP